MTTGDPERFTLSCHDGRWSLVTPSGTPMFSLGVTHLLQIREQKAFRSVYGGDHEACAEDVAARLRSWGFNSAGYGSVNGKLDAFARRLPFFASVEVLDTSMWRGDDFAFADVFDPVWKTSARARIHVAFADLRGLPFLVGVYWTDTPRWTLPHHTGRTADWLGFIRGLPTGAPGKQAWVGFLAAQHASFHDWKRRHGIDARSWEDVAATRAWPAGTTCGDDGFLAVIAREYYACCAASTREVVPGVLVFGDRYFGPDVPEEVVREAAPYIDAASVQPVSGLAFDTDGCERLRRLAGEKPVMVCDVAVNFPTPGHPRVLWPAAPDEIAAAESFLAYVETARATGFVLGVHRCSYMDLPKPGGILKQGLVRQDNSPYEAHCRTLTRRLLN